MCCQRLCAPPSDTEKTMGQMVPFVSQKKPSEIYMYICKTNTKFGRVIGRNQERSVGMRKLNVSSRPTEKLLVRNNFKSTTLYEGSMLSVYGPSQEHQ
jgi:hypothetical protein